MYSEINISNMSKEYDGKLIFKDINQIFNSNNSYAFVGHNGCGKSTLIRIIAGLTAPTTGKIHYNNKLNIAYVPDRVRPVKLTGRSYLISMGEIGGISKSKLNSRINALAKDFFIEEMLDIPMYALSKGTMQKIIVIQAMLNKPDVMLLDEPLSGQDKESMGVFVGKINELRNSGCMIIMACHEEWLTEAISDTTFTIKNKTLMPYIRPKNHNYVLILNKAKDSAETRKNMSRYGDGYMLIVNEKEADEQILSLLENGWKLKGMYDEVSRNTKISAENIF